VIVFPIEYARNNISQKKYDKAKKSAIASGDLQIYSHSRVMKRYKTKSDVIKGFGSPSIKNIEFGIEIWTFIINHSKNINESINISGNSSGNISKGYNNSIDIQNTVKGGGNSNISITENTDYVEFQFEDGENVSHWRSRGVNKGYKTSWTGPKVIQRWGGLTVPAFLIDCALLGVVLGNID